MQLADLPLYAAAAKQITITPLNAALLLYALNAARGEFESDDQTESVFDDLIYVLLSDESPPPMSAAQYALIQHRLPAGTNGGAALTGGWYERPLNHTSADTIGVTLANNRVTLPPGSYVIAASAQFFWVGDCRIRLYNHTANAVIGGGGGGYSNSNAIVVSDTAAARAYVQLAAAADISVQYRVTRGDSSGLGYAAPLNWSTDEIYCTLEILKI